MDYKEIFISDVTLKDCFHSYTNSLSFKEKLNIAKKLCDLNVDAIELGKIVNEKTDPVLFRTIAGIATKSTVVATADIDNASILNTFNAISNAKNKRVAINVPSSSTLLEYVYQKKAPKVCQLIKGACEYAKSLTSDVEISLEDATRGEIDYLVSIIKTAIDVGVDTFSIIDLVGTMLPNEFYNFLNELFNKVPQLKEKKVYVQCSNALNLAIASSMASLNTPVVGIKTTTTNDDAPKISLLANIIASVGEKHGFKCSLNYTALNKIVKQIENITTDTHSKSVLNSFSNGDLTILNAEISEEELTEVIKKQGYDLSAEDSVKVYEVFKTLSIKKSVSIKELEVIIANTALQVPPTFKLKDFVINSGNIIVPTASITLIKDNEDLFGLSNGDGPIDAAFMAIEKITGHHFELDDFQIQSITEGKEAVGEALIKLRNNGKIYSGRGISTDIIGASIRAYISALNKIVYEEANS